MAENGRAHHPGSSNKEWESIGKQVLCAYNQNFFVFHPMFMKLGEIVVPMYTIVLQLRQVSSKSDEKQKSPLVFALWKVLTLWHCVKIKQRYLCI